MRAELLLSPRCPHAEAAEEVVRRAFSDAGFQRQPLERVYVDDLDHAAGLGLHGSPTLRIDGRDVALHDGLPISLDCRMYAQPDGTQAGVIPAETIFEHLRAREQEAAELKAARARPGLGELLARLSRALFLWASRRGSLERLSMALPFTRALVRRFVAAEDLEGALEVLRRLEATGLRWTVDILGESVTSNEMAEAAADRYIATLDALAGAGLEANVSLKLSQMGLGIDHDFCQRNLRRVIRRAAELGAFVRIDMEDHTVTDITLGIAREMHADYHDVGVVIQSYLRRSEADVEQLIREQIRVRLCKGAYDEPVEVAFQSRAEVDESFVRLMERLMRDGRYPAIATHDHRLIEHAIEFAQRHGIDPARYEFQMLYGVRRDLQERLVAQGYTVRVYVPYGTEWYPYYMRRLAERPANVLFVLRSLLPARRG